MARPVELRLDITADADGVDDGVRQAERALEDLEDAARDTERVLEDLEDVSIDVDTTKAEQALKASREDLDRLRDQYAEEILLDVDTKATEKELRQAEREVKQLGRIVDSESKKMGADLDRGFSKGTAAMGGASAEFRDEATQNFSEVTSSFSGDMTGAVDLVQGTLGGLASGIAGPLGIALGGAAVGVGLIATKFTEAAEKADELGEAAAEMGRELYEALPAERMEIMNERLEEFLFTSRGSGFGWWRETATAVEDLNALLEEGVISGQAYTDLLMAQGPEEFSAALGGLNTTLEGTREAYKDLENSHLKHTATTERLGNQYSQNRDLIDRMRGATKEANETTDQAVAAEQAREQALILSGEAYYSATGEVLDFEAAQEEANEALDAAADVLKEAESALDDYLGTLGNSRAAYDDFLDASDALSAAVEENGLDFESNAAAARDNRDALDAVTKTSGEVLQAMVEQGASVDDVTAKHSSMRDGLQQTLIQMGLDEQAARDLADEYLGLPDEVETLIDAQDKATKEVEDAQEAYDSLPDEVDTDIVARVDEQSLTDARNRFRNYFARNGASLPVRPSFVLPDTPGFGDYARSGRSASPAAPAVQVLRVNIAGREVSGVVASSVEAFQSQQALAGLYGRGGR